jgi:MFS superfamily sulfate permease-like transporter
MIAGAGVIFVGMIDGIVIGIAAAVFEVFRRAMTPDRSVASGDEPGRYYAAFTPEMIAAARDTLVYRFGAALFFGNAEVFLGDMRRIARHADPSLRTVLIDAGTLGVPDATARDSLRAAQQALERKNIALVFGNVRHATRVALEATGGFTIVDEQAFLAAMRAVRGHPSTAIK